MTLSNVLLDVLLHKILLIAPFVDDFDPKTDDPDVEGKCSVVLALMQEHRRSQRHLGVKTLQIGFILYKVSTTQTGKMQIHIIISKLHS